MNIRKANSLLSTDELNLSIATQNRIQKSKINLEEIVRIGRIEAYNLRRAQNAKTKPPKWRLELAEALDQAGFIRHDINEKDLFILNRFRRKYFDQPDPESLPDTIKELATQSNIYEGYIPDYDNQIETILQMLEPLTVQEQMILKLRFGIDCERPQTSTEIGVVFGVTGCRIDQIEAKAARRLRHRGDEIAVCDLIKQIEALSASSTPEAAALWLKLQQYAENDATCAANQAMSYLIKHHDYLKPDSEIEKLHLSAYANNYLKDAQIHTIEQVVESCYSHELENLPRIGWYIANEVISRLISIGLVDAKKLYPDSELDQLNLSVRARNCLEDAKLLTIDKITALTWKDLLKVRNLGHITANEIERALSMHGYSLREE